jgi:hypothetical protein
MKSILVFVKLNLKTLLTLVVVILVISSAYVIFFTSTENVDKKPPIINIVTGNVTGKKGETITIHAAFSDNVAVAYAELYYRTITDTNWNSKSILSGSVNIFLNSNKSLYYFVEVDDAAGNGPVTAPSDSGTYYTISVVDDNNNGDVYVRNVFVEEGAFTTCIYCPIVAEMLYELYSSGDYNFYYVSLIRTNDKAANRLDNEYNLYGLPTVFIDGGYKVIMGGMHEKSEYAQAIRDAEYRNAPKIQLTVTAEYDNNTHNLISNVFVKNKESNSYDGRLRVYLTEKVSRWSGPEGQPYHFGFLDYIINEDILINGDENVSFKGTSDVSDLDPENLMVIAAVFNSEKKQGYSDPPTNKYGFDAYYADAAGAAEIIEGGNLPPTAGFVLPKAGYLHVFGNPIFKFKQHSSTILIGKSKIEANVEDDKGIAKVEFYINGNLVYEDTQAPFEYNMGKFNRILSKLNISIIAYDEEGKTGTHNIEVIALIFLK